MRKGAADQSDAPAPPFNCLTCAGLLRRRTRGHSVHYCCENGHEQTEEELNVGCCEAAEAALRVAVGALAQFVESSRRLRARAVKRGSRESAAYFEHKMQHARAHIEALGRLLPRAR